MDHDQAAMGLLSFTSAVFLITQIILIILIKDVSATIIIIIISPLQSTAGHWPLQILAISLDLGLLASSSCQPFCANRHSTWPEGVLHYVYRDAVSTPELFYD
jgi:Cu/Ag efflux pump CusA